MLSETEILAACTEELQESTTVSELSDSRAKAMRYYLGEPYGDETEQRSQIITREVLESVEWITPSLMRIYMEGNAVSFDAEGPEDEDAAEQETDVVSHIFWNQNNGFYNILTAIKDGLLSKTGWLKIWFDESETEEREEYTGQDEMAIMALLTDDSVEREVIEHEISEDGQMDITFIAKNKRGKVRIMPCAPEDIGVNGDAYSPLVEDCRFVYHQVRRSRSSLVEEGFPRELIDKIPSGNEAYDEERLARRNLEDDRISSEDMLWITECYIKLDRDEDGIDELLKVVMGGAVSIGTGGGSNIVLSVEEYDRFPFVSWTPMLLTHKFTGLSIADLQMDVQYAKSTLLRNMFDNIYHMNNTERAVNDRVNIEDMMMTMPGGIKRVSGTQPVGDSIMSLAKQALTPQSFELLGVLDEMTKGRTGVGADVASLDPSALANVNTGVAALSYDAARARIELIARMGAEFLLRPAFRLVHELASKNIRGRLAMKLKNKWVDVHPGEWKSRENITANVGIGRASKERETLALERVMEKQLMAAQNGGIGAFVTVKNLYNVAHDYTKVLGLDPERYWTNPEQIPPPPEPEPDVQQQAIQLQAQIEQAKLQLEGRKQEAAEKKLRLDAEARIVEQSLKQRQLQGNTEIARIKAEMGIQKTAIDEQSQIMNAQAQINSKEADVAIKARELELKEFIEKNKLLLDARSQEIEVYKAELANITKMMADMSGQIETYTQRSEALAQASEMDGKELRGTISGKLEELITELNEPITVEKGEDGEIVRIGNTDIE